MVIPITIRKRHIGLGYPCFVIAEAGVNHNGNLAMAKQLIDAAVLAGADAVKFQTFRADRLAMPDAPKAIYQQRNGKAGESQLAMLRRLELDAASHQALRHYCLKKGILFLSTPFDMESVDLLASLEVPLFKIGSGDVTDSALLRYIGKQHRPVILSTGMATLSEVKTAVQTLFKAGARRIALLHCVSNYPADPVDVNLRAMDTLRKAFRCPIGYSDHTLGIEVALAAVARGANIVEKHLTLRKSLPGPDHRISLEPREFKAMVEGIRMIEKALGNGLKVPAISEKAVARVARKSLIAIEPIQAGERLREECLAARRPGTGIPASSLHRVIGHVARQDIPSGTMLTLEMIG